MNPNDMQSSNEHDRAIDTTLAALRGAARPPAGLEQRVLQNLAEQTLKSPRAGLRIAWVAIPAAVCAALALLAVPALRHTQNAPSPVASNTAFPPDSMPVSHPIPAVQLLAREVPNRPPRSARTHPIAVTRENSIASTHADAPLPSAPLTEQERLLLQIARSGDASQRAMLNPEVLAREESAEDADFRNFFAKSPNVQTRHP